MRRPIKMPIKNWTRQPLQRPGAAEGTPPRSFELVSTQALPSAISFSLCKVAGSLKTGLFDDATSVNPDQSRSTNPLEAIFCVVLTEDS